jgi:hypothetical protein
MIAPRFDVHSTLDQDPGLLSINIDYGFMCAADVAGDIGLDDYPCPPVARLATLFPTPPRP